MGKGSRTKKQKKRKEKRVSLAPMPAAIANHQGRRWDRGPNTQAQRAGKVVEDAEYFDEETGEKVNPNGVKRLRKIDLVEHYARKGVIDRRQMLAGITLRSAFEGTQRTAPAIKKVQVDSTPKPDQHVEIMIDRLSRFADVFNGLNGKYREILDCVVLNNCHPAWLKKYRGRRYVRGIEVLQEALSALSDHLEN